MLGDELDILECRLRELEEVPDLVHVLVEAAVTHRGNPKPYYFAENQERFSAWRERIIRVMVPEGELPTDPDPWSREYAQREFAKEGLREAKRGDIILHGDADEIPNVAALRENPAYPVAFQMRLCQYAVDWVHPLPWHGTIRTRYGTFNSFAHLRTMRNSLTPLPNAGSHLSWMGGTETHIRKLGLHCHLEMTQATEEALRSGQWLREGIHSDGHKLNAVDVDDTWPRWVHERKCPENWFRPREEN